MKCFLAVLLICFVVVGCDSDHIDRSDKPLTHAEASRHLSFALPASAKDVYFLVHSDGLQWSHEFVRFTVDPDELDATVEVLLAKHSPASMVYNPQIASDESPTMTWWTPDTIAKGKIQVGDRPPIYLWTDVDSHTIFVCITD